MPHPQDTQALSKVAKLLRALNDETMCFDAAGTYALIKQAADAIDALTADRDSWQRQADDRASDAVAFAARAEKAEAEVTRLTSTADDGVDPRTAFLLRHANDAFRRAEAAEAEASTLRRRVEVLEGALRTIASPTYWGSFQIDSDGADTAGRIIAEMQRIASAAFEQEGGRVFEAPQATDAPEPDTLARDLAENLVEMRAMACVTSQPGFPRHAAETGAVRRADDAIARAKAAGLLGGGNG